MNTDRETHLLSCLESAAAELARGNIDQAHLELCKAGLIAKEVIRAASQLRDAFVVAQDNITELNERLEQSDTPWREAILEALEINFSLTKENMDDPERALSELVTTEINMALDPRISLRAKELVDSGKEELKASLKEWADERAAARSGLATKDYEALREAIYSPHVRVVLVPWDHILLEELLGGA